MVELWTTCILRIVWETKMVRAGVGPDKWEKEGSMDSTSLWCQRTWIWKWLSKPIKLNSTMVRRGLLKCLGLCCHLHSHFSLCLTIGWRMWSKHFILFINSGNIHLVFTVGILSAVRDTKNLSVGDLWFKSHEITMIWLKQYVEKDP